MIAGVMIVVAEVPQRLPDQQIVLLTLRRLGPPYTGSPSLLADHLGLTRGALSARLASVEDAGLIVRTHEDDDRRRVRLTEAGHAAFEQQVASEEAGELALLSALTPAERRTLADLLRKLVVAAESSPNEPRRPGSAVM
jgi:DNA-binding MarR family transcriptional regulator